jgi:hypothetical protein
MRINSPFYAVLDTGKTTSEGSVSAPSPRPVSPPKFQPFSRFNISESISSSSVSDHSHIDKKLSASSHSHLDKELSGSVFSTVSHSGSLSHRQKSSSQSHITASSHTNTYHARFSSSLSRTLSTSSTAPFSARSSKLTSPSPFRPYVPAPHRLSSWSSPSALKHRRVLESSLPTVLVDSAFQTVHDALAPSTRSTYSAGVLRFNQFCDSWGIDDDARLPASATLLTAFVGQCRGLYAGKTIRSWLSGIRAWHILQQVEWHGDHEWVSNARVTAHKEGTSFKRPLRAPVSLEHLHVLRCHLNLTIPLHAAIWAVATTTFFGCRRLGISLFIVLKLFPIL